MDAAKHSLFNMPFLPYKKGRPVLSYYIVMMRLEVNSASWLGKHAKPSVICDKPPLISNCHKVECASDSPTRDDCLTLLPPLACTVSKDTDM
eukprot:scaffold318836_cov76-Attheya_sp.AAC.1